jgi:hypothetical protein
MSAQPSRKEITTEEETRAVRQKKSAALVKRTLIGATIVDCGPLNPEEQGEGCASYATGRLKLPELPHRQPPSEM